MAIGWVVFNVAKTATNNFGDFLVDKLEPGAAYSVAIMASGYEPVELEAVPTVASLTLPSVALRKA